MSTELHVIYPEVELRSFRVLVEFSRMNHALGRTVYWLLPVAHKHSGDQRNSVQLQPAVAKLVTIQPFTKLSL